MGRSRTPDLGKKEIQSENKLKDASFWMKMESKEDEKWNPKHYDCCSKEARQRS